MLTFLRKVRKSLIDSGSTRRYLIYAIGEILLVMIGILLALQVNNWNEWRKDRIKERQILEQIQDDLESNVKLYESVIGVLNRYDGSSRIVLTTLEENITYKDSLDRHFFLASLHGGRRISRVLNSGYTELINAGIDLISSDTLKESILNLYEGEIPDTKMRLQNWQSNYSDYNSYIIGLFIAEPGYRHPIDYQALLNDTYIYSIFKMILDERRQLKLMIQWNKEDSQTVLDLITKELDSID